MGSLPENFDPFEDYEQSGADSKQQALLRDIAHEQPMVYRELTELINHYPKEDHHRRNAYRSGVVIAYKYLKAIDHLPNHVRSMPEIAQFLGERIELTKNMDNHRRNLDPQHQGYLLQSIISGFFVQTRALNQNLANAMNIYSQSKPMADRIHFFLGVYDIAGLLLYTPPQLPTHS